MCARAVLSLVGASKDLLGPTVRISTQQVFREHKLAVAFIPAISPVIRLAGGRDSARGNTDPKGTSAVLFLH